jgi:hypothetical protein
MQLKKSYKTVKTFLILSIMFWWIWGMAELTASNDNVLKLREKARGALTALHSRVGISPGNRIIRYFQVHYNEPHYIGLEFDDKKFADSLFRYNTSPDFGFEMNWILYGGIDSVRGSSFKRPLGESGGAVSFGEFNAITGKQYKLEMNIISLPKFTIYDSAWIEVGVNRAAVSVGNEFVYGLFLEINDIMRKISLYMAVGMSLLTLVIWVRKLINRVHSDK